MSERPLKALLVSYLFPPVGGAGVARVLKFAKYLPKHGVEPTVMTAANPSVPVVDESRLADAAGMRVVRVRTLEPSYKLKRAVWSAADGSSTPRNRRRSLLSGLGSLLVPDPQVLWLPAAQWRLLRLLRSEPFDVVFISGPPFSQFLLAPFARLLKRPVVLDYRDEWGTVAAQYEMGGVTRRWSARVLEPLCLRAARTVTTVTPAFSEALVERFPFLDRGSVVTLPNGYDPDDIPRDVPDPVSRRYVVTYAGTVFRLTRPSGLLRALARLRSENPLLAELLDVRFIGRVVETEQRALAEASHLGVRTLGYMEHGAALVESARSHLNLCLLSSVPGAERIYPQKIFELAALGRPVLTLAPPGALAALAPDLGLHPAIHPEDDVAIARFLTDRLTQFQAGTPDARQLAKGVERFSREALAGELAELFRAVSDGHPRRSST